MAYNYPAPPLDIPDGGPGLPPIFPGAGIGKSFNLDVGAGLGGFPGGFGGLGGGFPGWSPYVPVTPLGGLWGFKGDLIVPIVAIGVAIFLFILVVLAVKYALAWKIEVLDDLAGLKGSKFRREAGTAPAEHLEDANMNRLADMVAAAVYSEGCSKRILCEIGSYARDGQQYPSLLKLLELVVPEDYHNSFDIVQQSAKGSFSCSDHYPCGDASKKEQTAENEVGVDIAPVNKLPVKPEISPSANLTIQTGTSSTTPPPTTPVPELFGKFKRAFM